MQWFYEDLAGIRPLEPGYRTIEFKPEIPSRLSHAAAVYDSVRGKIASSWQKGHRSLRLDVRVPGNATGRVHVPAARPRDVEVDGGKARFVGSEAGRLVYEVGPGRYEFRARR